MLRKVPLEEVRLGMFVHAMEGSWLQHPFWRKRFVLDNAQARPPNRPRWR